MQHLTFAVSLDIDQDDRGDEFTRIFEQYLTEPEHPFLNDYGPNAWGGYEGPKVVGTPVVTRTTVTTPATAAPTVPCHRPGCTADDLCLTCCGDRDEARADAWADARAALDGFDLDGWYMNGGHFTCREADAIGAMLLALELPDHERSLRVGHAEADEEGDAHYQGDTETHGAACDGQCGEPDGCIDHGGVDDGMGNITSDADPGL